MRRHAKAPTDINPPDITPADFRNQLRQLGFAYLGGTTNAFIDIREHQARRQTPVIPAVMNGRALNRAASIAACEAARGAAEQVRQAAAARLVRQIRTAENIAPTVLPRPRAGLTGAPAVAQLADDFRTIATRDGSVTFKDLLLTGWTAEQLRIFGDQARQLGQRQEAGALA